MFCFKYILKCDVMDLKHKRGVSVHWHWWLRCRGGGGSSLGRRDLAHRVEQRLLHAHFCWRLSLPGQTLLYAFNRPPWALQLMPKTQLIVLRFLSSFFPGLCSRRLRVGVGSVYPRVEGKHHHMLSGLWCLDSKMTAFPFFSRFREF